MNLSFLGDAFDYWKGSLIESLQESKTVECLAVDPMLTDLPSWGHEDHHLYARLMRVTPSKIIHHKFGLRDRTRYLAEIRHEGDLFLDPDTGVATGRIKNPAQYVAPSEIGPLVDGGNNRLVIVYQHVRGRVSRRVDSVLAAITREIGSVAWCSYESGTVAMIFLARDTGRPASVAAHFNAVLGRHAEGRIRSG